MVRCAENDQIIMPVLRSNLQNILFDENRESFEKDSVLSVTALSQQLKQEVESVFAKVVVRGEISGFKKHTSGHLYFSLKDPDGDAVLNAICWRGTHTAISLEEGLDVIIHGRITTYPNRSNYQIIVSSAEAAGEGALLKLLIERKKQFEKEGLFANHRALPKYPTTIGVVTSPTGAVIQDILHRLADRYPCHVVLWPVAVQGNGAAEQIAHAISQFNLLSSPYRPDVLIVARGGGSIEDLWPFNEECVVRATYQSQIPVISAVGHETDTTLIDYAADLRAPTPTAAAELATPVKSQIMSDLIHFQHRSVQALLKRVETMELKLQTQKLPKADQWIHDRLMILDDLIERLMRSIKQNFQQKIAMLTYAQKLLKLPQNIISLAEIKIPNLRSRQQILISHYLNNTMHLMESLAQRLKQSSYASIMDRGFCVITDAKGIMLKKSMEVRRQKPAMLQIHFNDGIIQAIPQTGT